MQVILTTDITYNIWWVLMNSVIYYAEVVFLFSFCRSSNKMFSLYYVAINILLTIIAIRTQMFNLFGILHIALLFILTIGFLKIAPKQIINPAIIIFTLSTFREGFVAVFMQYLSSVLRSKILGNLCQFALPAILTGLFFLTLRYIAKKFPLINQKIVSSYLYILLLPSAIIIAGIRTSLGLDSKTGDFSHGALIEDNLTSVLYATLWMTGALIVFFIILKIFHKIVLLSYRETEYALLANEIKEQHGYIDEARQRNEQYRSFQHDINNHLLVLSGLLHSQEYEQAEKYLEKLNMTASDLSNDNSTGNSVLDILLWEKVRYAKQYNITVTCDVQIPNDCVVDDIDLCIMFANGIDNAIEACKKVDLECRSITITAKPKHTFLLIDIANSVVCSKALVYGTGLKNVELTAKKYAGVIQIKQASNQFLLSILLCYKNF